MNKWLILSGLLSVVSAHVNAADYVWVGGDQSGVSGSTFHVAENWSMGEVPVEKTNADAVWIHTDGDRVRWVSGWNLSNIMGPTTIGSSDSPSVEVEFCSVRGDEPSNLNPTKISLVGKLTVLGSNTVVRVNEGVLLNFNVPFMELDEASTLCGEGVLQFGDVVTPIISRDYDGLWLQFGTGHWKRMYSLAGDVSTRGDVKITSEGSAGVNNYSALDLRGFTLTGRDLVLGARIGTDELGRDRPGFGQILIDGAVLNLAGDISLRSNPDGVSMQGEPVQEDSGIMGGPMGATINLSGSFTNITSKTPAVWALENVALVFTGDGSKVQMMELMSEDLGDTQECCIGNYAWGTVRVASGARVALVDAYDNARQSLTAEVMYVGKLIVEEGATLDLNGHTIYVAEQAEIAGMVVNSGAIRQLTKTGGLLYHYAVSLGQTDPTYGNGMWFGPSVVGDINADGIPELIVATIDEAKDDDDCRIFAFQYANGAVTSLPNYPRTERGFGDGYYVDNFLVDDIGNGAGKQFYFHATGWGRIFEMGEDAEGRCLTPREGSTTYNVGDYIFVDLDGDGSKELICSYRVANHSTDNFRVFKTTDGSILWKRTILGAGGLVVQVGAADLDGDGQLEVFGVAKRDANTDYGLSAFRADGSPYVSPYGNVVSNLYVTATAGEYWGGISAADVDGDGVPEFIYAAAKNLTDSDGLTVTKQDGTMVFSIPKSNVSAAQNGFALFDVNCDGAYEILYGSALYDGEGNLLQQLPIAPSAATAVGQLMMPVLADFTGDQIPEAVYVTASGGDAAYGRHVCVYDFVKRRILPGFPVDLKMILESGSTNNRWRAGVFHHWGGSTPLVADLDNDGDWEIIVGTGTENMNNNDRTSDSPTLNIIDTPYKYSLPEGRSPEQYGWYSHRYNALCDFKYPAYIPRGTLLILR